MALHERQGILDGHSDEQSDMPESPSVREEAEGWLEMVIAHWNSLVLTFRTRASEWMLGGAIMSLGLLFRFRPTMFVDDGFRSALDIAPQTVWAWGLTVIGVVRLTVLLINGAWWTTPIFRSITAALSCFLWFQLFLGFMPNFSIMFALTPWLFMLDAFNAIRTGKESGITLFHTRKVHKRR